MWEIKNLTSRTSEKTHGQTLTMTEFVSSQHFVKITSKLRLSGYLSDARIILDDHTYYDVHKLLLAANSDYFRVLFSFNNNTDLEYRLQKVSKEGFEPILSWMYKHEMKLTKDNVGLILSQAHYLDCREVTRQCVKWILDDLCVENALGYESFARAFSISELVRQCARYVKYNFVFISQTGEFLELSLEELGQLLDSEDLNANEHHVWTAMMRWIKHEKTKRVEHISTLLKKVRIGQFTEDFFRQVVTTDLQPFQPLEEETEALLHAAEVYYKILESVAKVDSPLDTPSFALPRLAQDVVLAFGGWTGGSACNLIESYDIRADRWTPLPFKDPFGERGYIGAAAIGSKIYLVGGTNGERHFNATSCFDVETKKFRVLGPMHSARCYISLTELDGYLYALGGYDGSRRLKTMERFDPEKNQWSLMAPMKTQRSDAGCAALGGKIYVAGGFDGIIQLDSVEVYTPKNNKWSTVPKMSTKRSGVSCVALNGDLYVLGGFDGNRRLRSCEKFDPRTKKWTTIPEMMTTRSNFSAVVVEDTIMVIGGFNGYTTSELVECFDPALNCWCSSSDLRVHRSALSVCVVPGRELSGDILGEYAYPNRDKLPEEKRLYERSLERLTFEEQELEEEYHQQQLLTLESDADIEEADIEEQETLSEQEAGNAYSHSGSGSSAEEDDEDEALSDDVNML